MDAFTPAQTTELISRIGARKARMRVDKIFINSFLGGALLSFGCALSLSTSSSPWFQTNAPGLIRTISAMVFPIGLIMVVLTGADLFTSYCMYSTVSLLHRRISLLNLLKTWGISLMGNLIGALFVMGLLTGCKIDGGIFDQGAFRDQALANAKIRAVVPRWHQIFLKGILCNWLVCLAVFLSISSREVFSKILSIWFPVMCFVGLGTDHVVANMFFIPLAIFLEAPAPLSTSYYIWKSMLPSLLGNAIGGGVFVGGAYWHLFLSGGQEVEIHFDGVGGDGKRESEVMYTCNSLRQKSSVASEATRCDNQSENGSSKAVEDGAKLELPSSCQCGLSRLGEDLDAIQFRRSGDRVESKA
ncbi:Formate/nitrite transporter-domain-containing protein [Amylocarpus encephaloides]|uniref:Formate/nitrite transporter-domain-containing protein n=1 Tax=Amylocarpus encephaloides TaxID=45428 RepID=A0A9P7Y921_9HELO|nr:Formate/nitrite transporter-domain-containing protein [Amylocarpus encephaloides]